MRSKRPSSLNLKTVRPGRCRYCRCTDARSCPDGCSWYDAEETVCNSSICVALFRVALADCARKLIRVGINKTGFLKSLSCYGEAAVVIDTLLTEMRSDAGMEMASET